MYYFNINFHNNLIHRLDFPKKLMIYFSLCLNLRKLISLIKVAFFIENSPKQIKRGL